MRGLWTVEQATADGAGEDQDSIHPPARDRCVVWENFARASFVTARHFREGGRKRRSEHRPSSAMKRKQQQQASKHAQGLCKQRALHIRFGGGRCDGGRPERDSLALGGGCGVWWVWLGY